MEISISNIYRMLDGLYDMFGAIWIPHRFRITLDSGDAFISVSFLVFHVDPRAGRALCCLECQYIYEASAL